MATQKTSAQLEVLFAQNKTPSGTDFADFISSSPNLLDNVVTDAEFSHLNGTTSAIQTQIDSKLSTTGGAMSGAITGNVAITGFRPYLTETTSRALALADAGKFIIANNASGVTLTIPSSVFTLGTEIDFIQKTAGTLTLTAVAGVTLNGTVAGSAAVTAIWGGVTIKLIATNEWVAVGKI
tara:strand:+ start:1500 stop:2042 length:543 start_codon:yes stop_codon:yes gene_type:complete